MLAYIGRWLGIREGELPRTAGMFLYLLMAVGAFITGRITRDALFLSRYDISYLPYMYVWVALGMVLLSYLYSHFADRFRRDRLIQTVTAILLVGVVTARFLLMLTGDWFLPVLYVFVEVMGGLLLIQFWTFANEIFTTREAKRLFGLVGAGGVAATIVAGFTIGGLAHWIGTENLLFVCAGLLFGCLVSVTMIGRTCQRELTLALSDGHSDRRISFISDLGRVFSSRHLKVIAWITISTFVAITIVDYQFKIIARYTFLNREDQLTGFFGWFYGVSGVLSFFIQFLLTGRLLQRFGIIVSLLLLPLVLSAGSGLLLIFPGLWAVTLLKGSDNVLRYTVNDATTQVLYLPVPSRIRGRAKAFIDGMLKPVAQGLCGLALAWTGAWVGHRVDWLGVGSMAALGALVILIIGLKKGYIQSLVSTLRQRKIHFGESTFSISDSQAVAALEQTLADEDQHHVLHALEMIPYVQRHDWSDNLVRLLQHSSAEIRLQAIRLLGRSPADSRMERVLARVLALLGDPDQDVRAEAVGLYCAALKEKAMGAIEPLLQEASVRVKASAAVGLIRFSGLDGIIAAADTLKSMLASTDPEHRIAGAWSVGQVGVKTFYRSLMPLLEDPDPAVRVEAVRAAGELRSPELMLSLIYRLADPLTQRAAVSALASFGPGLLATMRTILSNPREELEIRLAIPEVMARIGEQQSMDILSSFLDTDETKLRARALDAIVQLHLRHPNLRRDREMLRRALHRDLKQAFQQIAILRDIEALDADLLKEAIRDRHLNTIDRIFKLMRVLHPGRHLEMIHRNLTNPVAAVQANAIELLENVLDAETRRCLLPLIEMKDMAALVSIGDELFPLLHREPKGWLHELLVSDHAWTVAATLDVIRHTGDATFEPAVQILLKHRSPLVRETAAFCMGKLAPPDRFAAALEPLVDDPHPQVRSAVRWLRPVRATE